MHPPKGNVPQLCKHSKDALLDSLYDIMHRVQSSIMTLTNVTIYYKALVITATLHTILQTFLFFSALCLKDNNHILFSRPFSQLLPYLSLKNNNNYNNPWLPYYSILILLLVFLYNLINLVNYLYHSDSH